MTPLSPFVRRWSCLTSVVALTVGTSGVRAADAFSATDRQPTPAELAELPAVASAEKAAALLQRVLANPLGARAALAAADVGMAIGAGAHIAVAAADRMPFATASCATMDRVGTAPSSSSGAGARATGCRAGGRARAPFWRRHGWALPRANRR